MGRIGSDRPAKPERSRSGTKSPHHLSRMVVNGCSDVTCKQLFADDDAVSPVIGVVLLVAITVILASVIAVFVLNAPNQIQDPPSSNFAFDYDGTTVTVIHEGGEELDPDNLYIRGDDVPDGHWTSFSFAGENAVHPTHSRVVPGNAVEVTPSSDDFVLRVVYAEGDSSTTLQTHRGPDA